MKNTTGKGAFPGRRQFLKQSAAAAAAVAGFTMTRSASGQAAATTARAAGQAAASGANDKLVLAVIGHGSQGMQLLRSARNQAAASNVEVAAVCDLWEKRLEQARARAELPESAAHREYRRILDDKSIDAVLIATPTHTHAKIAIEAMEAGKHVYIEKPTTRYLRESFEVYDTAKRTGRVVQVGMQGCSLPKWQVASDIVRGGGIGPPVLAQASYMRNSGSQGEWNVPIDDELTAGGVDWRAWLGPVRGNQPFSGDTFFRWRKYYPYSPGILGELLPHRVGPMMLATGKPEFPRRVACLGTQAIQTGDRDITDNTQVLAEFPSGLTLLLLGSTVNEQGLPEVVRGHHATMTIGGNRITVSPERPFSDEVDPADYPDIPAAHMVTAHQADWFNCIRNGGEPNAGAEMAVRLDTVLHLAEMSERLNTLCVFDAETRSVTTADGQPVELLDYDNEPFA